MKLKEQVELEKKIELLEKLTNKKVILGENYKLAQKNYLEKDLISSEDLESLKELDPSKTNKYTYFLTKCFVEEGVKDLDLMRNVITEYDALASGRSIEKADITQVKNFKELQEIVKLGNAKKSASINSQKKDFKIIRNDSDVLVTVPYTHEASAYLGKKYFASPSKIGLDGQPECVWCTTYGTNNHWNNYTYGGHDLNFFYIWFKSPEKHEELKKTFGKEWKKWIKVAYFDGAKEGICDYIDDKEVYDKEKIEVVKRLASS